MLRRKITQHLTVGEPSVADPRRPAAAPRCVGSGSGAPLWALLAQHAGASPGAFLIAVVTQGGTRARAAVGPCVLEAETVVFFKNLGAV